MKFDVSLMFDEKMLLADDKQVGWILLTTDGKFIAKLLKSDIEVVCGSESEALEILKAVAFAGQMGYRVSSLQYNQDTKKLDIQVIMSPDIEYIDVNVRVG